MSELAVSFELQRYLLSIFFQSYFPGVIMVILGGLSMFLDAKSVLARVSMGKIFKFIESDDYDNLRCYDGLHYFIHYPGF